MQLIVGVLRVSVRGRIKRPYCYEQLLSLTFNIQSKGRASVLALLWQFGFDGVGEEFLTVGASPGWRPCEEVEDGLPDGRHARLWRRSPDSFFSVPLL